MLAVVDGAVRTLTVAVAYIVPLLATGAGAGSITAVPEMTDRYELATQCSEPESEICVQPSWVTPVVVTSVPRDKVVTMA